jgi:hypothetical protein
MFLTLKENSKREYISIVVSFIVLEDMSYHAKISHEFKEFFPVVLYGCKAVYGTKGFGRELTHQYRLSHPPTGE